MKLLCLATALLTAAGLAVLVQHPYWESQHAGDDVDHVREAESYLAGEVDFLTYVSKPHNEHLLPLWKTWYAVMWQRYPHVPKPWHICITLMHAFGALCLFAIVLHSTDDFLAAWLCCALWATAAIGQWDNPLQWIAASHLTMGFAWLLAALYGSACVQQKSALLGGIVTAAFLFAAFLSMGSMLLLTPILPLHFWLFHREETNRDDSMRWWLAWWLLPVLCCGGIQLSLLTFKLEVNAELGWQAPKGAVSVPVGLQQMAKSYRIAIGDYLAPFVSAESKDVCNVVLAIGAILAIALIGNRRGYKTFAVLFGMSIVFSTAAFIARSPWGDTAATFSRLRYLPTFGWCVLLGLSAAGLVRRLPAKGRSFGSLVLLFALAFLIYQQMQFAERAHAEFVKIVN